MATRKAIAGNKRSSKTVTSKLTSKVREGGAKLKSKMGAKTTSARTTVGSTPKTTSIGAKSAVSRKPLTQGINKSVKKPASAKRVSTVHLIGRRGEGARTPAVVR